MNKELQQQFLKELNANLGIIHRITRSFCKDQESRQDLFQEVVFQLWKSYPAFNRTAKFSTWMYKVALNTAIVSAKKERKIAFDALNNRTDFVENSDPQTDEKIDALNNAIATLPALDKAIVLLFLDGQSYEEIAMVTGLSKSNVSVRLMRLKKTLEEKMKNQIF